MPATMASFDPDIRILLAAPSPRVRAAVKRVLIEAGARVQTVADGDAAAQASVDTPPDLLITLLDLPHIRGRPGGHRPGAGRTHPLPVVWLLPASDARPAPESPWTRSCGCPSPPRPSPAPATCSSTPPGPTSPRPPRSRWPRPARPGSGPWPPSHRSPGADPATRLDLDVEVDVDVDLDAEDAEPGGDDDEMEVVEVDVERIAIPPQPGSVIAEGRLAAEPLGRLLVGAMETAFSGVLVIGPGGGEAHPPAPRPPRLLRVEPVGGRLWRSPGAPGLLDREALGRAAHKMIDDGIPQGEALVALGAITREALADAMHFHVRRRWSTASPGTTPPTAWRWWRRRPSGRWRWRWCP